MAINDNALMQSLSSHAGDNNDDDDDDDIKIDLYRGNVAFTSSSKAFGHLCLSPVLIIKMMLTSTIMTQR